MNSNLSEALILMIVGMSTVFAVLLIIIGFGKVLINLVNRYAPEEVVAPKTNTQVAPATNIAPQTTAAIAKAIEKITAGKAKVEKIERI